MSSFRPPEYAQILVIGGGPSGSYAAACLAREGFHVVLLEAMASPGNDIGESLLPSVRHHLRFIGVEEKIASFGFHKKPGATIKLSQLKRGAYTDFLALGRDNYAWNVTRSEFDRILLDHAESTGVHVFRSTNVTSLYFSGKRPTSAQWNHGTSSWSGTIAFDYLIDASGRAGLIASHYLQNRRSNASLRNVAMWAKWRNTDASARGTAMEGATYIEALSDQSGWAWFIPLHDGVASVGIVRTQIAFNQALRSRDYRLKLSESFEATPLKDAITTSSSVASCSDHDSSTSGQSTVVWDSTVLLSSLSSSPSPFSRGDACITPTATGKLYIDALDLAPTVNRLLGCKGEPESTTVYTARDYSYCASYYAGEHFRLVGDAAASIDPLFSSGVHLAMTSGLSAAASIAASIRGDCSESHAAEWHTQRVGVSYIRFLVVVLSAYKQMRAQSKDILCNIGEDNFDNAISFLRPVIHGNADLGPRLSDVEVQNALSFCAGLFTPVNPGASRAPRRYLGGGDEDPVPAPQESRTKLTKQDDVMAVRSSVGWSSVKPDAVTRWLEKVGGIPRDVLSDPFPYCPLTTPATPDRPSLPPRGGGRALSNTIPLLQAPSQHKLRRNFTALMDLNSPHVPPIRIRNIVGRQPCLPKGGSKVETRDGMKCIFEGMNDRGIINPKPGGLHSLEEELLGAGYTMRLQRGRLGLEARDWLS